MPDPPLYAFSLILLTGMIQVTVPILVGNLFKSTGVQPSQLNFAISRFVAGLATFVASPAGMLTAAFAIFNSSSSSPSSGPHATGALLDQQRYVALPAVLSRGDVQTISDEL